MPVINGSPINGNNNDDHYEALVERQKNVMTTMLLSEILILFQ